MKRTLTSFIVALIVTLTQAQTTTITEANGWIESAYVQWTPVENADKYAVYYSGEGINRQKLDDPLIRNYGTYFRADALGLKAGTYTMAIAAIINGVEHPVAETLPLTTIAHDRSGFAFVNGRIPGAYKGDGTPKDNAVILYVTEKNKNTLSMNVTGANANPCVGIQTILDGFKKGNDLRPLIVRFVGQITDPATLLGGDMVVENKQNHSSYITLEGVGDDAVADGWGIRVKGAVNIEIRNLGLMNCDSSEGDNLGLQQDNEYIWVHHCDLFYGHAGGDSDQAKGDGAMDCKGSGNVTFSYNHFWDSGKSNLLGNGEGSSNMRQTYHHNWYDHSDSRHPRVRIYTAHIYNNYYDGISKYGVGATTAASLYVEKNYFRNCPRPMMISMQGTDTKMGTDEKNSPTFSKEPGGMIKAFDNFMNGSYTFAPYSPDNTIHFDAVVTTSREETVPSSIQTKSGGHTYNNFDTDPSIMYAYTPDATSDVVSQVTKYAGRMNGGDFKWNFNNEVDDASYDLNLPLKNALITYTTTLVNVQGEDSSGGNPGGGEEEPGGGEIVGDVVHNFTQSGLISQFFTISGSISNSKGTVTYADLTLTHCLKIESASKIEFTTSTETSLTLVFNSTFNGKIKINGVDHTAAAGLLTTPLPAGTHTITKTDTSNLYFISIASTSTEVAPSALNAITLYPIPTADRLMIGGESTIQRIRLFNLSGVMVLHEEGNVRSFNLAHLPQGSYIIQIQTDKGTTQQRILKR